LFHPYRRVDVAAALKKCTACGQPLPAPLDAARPPSTLCPECARPIRLGAARAADLSRTTRK